MERTLQLRGCNVTLCALHTVCGASAVHLLADCSSPRAAVAARLRSASRGSAAFGAEVGRMAEKTAAMDISLQDSRLRCR
ncbi:hypothetical protein EYF80_010333 [Liparis tanakae]|uniref:Uncharacterized protein n=1 Tax=Liparis tanakae TaxID=230148 RepID=A0A4Z2INS6_9TELE|nr:hypothetical protein EYF80_010333 [Liparis tanakae]